MAENFNISPEIINNFVNILKNNDSNSTTNIDNESSTISTDACDSSIDFNKLGTLLSNFTSNSNFTSDNNSDSNNNANSIDFDTILKLKSIIETMNKKNDPRSNLLYSLKPYLRESKRSKLDQYANLLKITQVTGFLKNEKEN